ncbi:MAG: hypothetical protein EPN26_17010 [Rhodospirillales bacterium]|nr:MAG: hypothetical protein EPN26_17010 [Rhodospirillales bacterium]
MSHIIHMSIWEFTGWLFSSAIHGWKTSDFEPGMKYALAQNWVEAVSADAFRLTVTGFAAA